MKAGDLVVLINHKESDYSADPPKRVMMTGLITRATKVRPYSRMSGPGDPIPGWEVMCELGMIKRQEKALRVVGETPEHIQDLMRARDMADKRIQSWKKNNLEI
jgi:hypothetical protein